MARDVTMAETYGGVLPFVASDLVRILIILFAPWMALWAPGLWYG
jgi:TRAP-type C4-dicarboxylate transport system permease large subunit